MNLPENLNKLPKWAQSEIIGMQNKLKYLETEINRINENPKSNVFIGWETDIRGMPKPTYLKDYDTISFRLPKGEIRVRIDKDRLNINSSGEGYLSIKPSASNSINIQLI